MTIKRIFSVFLILTSLSLPIQADDYKESKEYLALRDSVHHAFNNGDSVRFYKAVSKLEDYLLKQDDLHAYYTQRCNEIVFELNRVHVFEAYKLATQLSKELADNKLDKEMYMAINMMGHIYRYSGNKESAKKCFWEVLERMQKEGYIESMPPIYMNLVTIIIDEDPQEALRLIDKALEIAREVSPTRTFDIEARRTLAFYTLGDKEQFMKGYEAYKEGVKQGLSSVHGRRLEICYLALQGRTDEAVQLAMQNEEDHYESQAEIYSKAGRWQEAFEALKKGAAESDSINSVILTGSMQGIQNELKTYEARRRASRIMFVSMVIVISLLLLLMAAIVYIYLSRRRHWRQIDEAYKRVLDAEKMRNEFIQNVSHEVRTPLNIISGFAQVLVSQHNDMSVEERQHISETMMHNTRIITTMINEVLEISRGDAYDKEVELTCFPCNELLRHVIGRFCKDNLRDPALVSFDSELTDVEQIRTHEVFLQRIINPLLDNAFKNAPKDDTRIVVHAMSSENSIVIAIEDNGPGIKAEEAEHVFERFVKLDAFKEGLGLGLTFSRTMARRLGGDVMLDTSFTGPGARFVVNLPQQN